MGDTSETNTKVLSRELFLGVVALKRLYLKIIICATRTLSQVRSHIQYRKMLESTMKICGQVSSRDKKMGGPEKQ